MNKFFIFIVLICYTSLAQPKMLSLEQAITHALKHNRNVINADRDIQIAYKEQWSTIATGLPQISASAGYSRALKLPVSLVPTDLIGRDSDSMGDPEPFTELTFGTKQSINAQVKVEQLIFDGSYIVGVQASKVYLAISQQLKVKTDQEITRLTTQAYLNALTAQDQVHILQKNVNTVSKNVWETKKVYENGLIEEENMLQLQITLSSLESQLNYAKRMVKVTLEMLNLMLGDDIGASYELSDSLLGLALQSENMLLEQELSITDNIDYMIALNSQYSQELLLKLAKSAALPKLAAFASAGYDGYGESFDFLDRKQHWFGRSTIGLSLDIPIFSSFGRHATTQKAKIELEKSMTNLELKEQELFLDLHNLRNDYSFALEDLKTAINNLNLAERIEQKNQVKFKEGLASSFELRQAQAQLYSAQNDHLDAMQKLIMTQTELQLILQPSPQNTK